MELVPYMQWGWYGMSFIVEQRSAVSEGGIGW